LDAITYTIIKITTRPKTHAITIPAIAPGVNFGDVVAIGGSEALEVGAEPVTGGSATSGSSAILSLPVARACAVDGEEPYALDILFEELRTNVA
jgi:hypothetical protein